MGATERTPRHSFQQSRRTQDADDDDFDKWSDFDADDALDSSGVRNDEASNVPEHGRLLDPDQAAEAFELGDRISLENGASGFKDPEAENSPYPEVRAAVRNYDEDVPANTVRAWTIGLALTVIGASMNTLFSLRQPSISIGPLVAQIVAYPIGHTWARIVPAREFNTFGVRWSLNPGPFNIKEHAVITVMAGVSFSVAYSTDIILAQLVFYKQDFGLLFQLLLTISTQSLGYGIAGVMRKFLGKSIHPVSRRTLLTRVSSLSCVHDLARKSCQCDFTQCHVRTIQRTGSQGPRRLHVSTQMVWSCVGRVLLLFLHSWLLCPLP